MKITLVSISALLSLSLSTLALASEPAATAAASPAIATDAKAANAADAKPVDSTARKPSDAVAPKAGEASAAIAGHVATLVASDDGLSLILREKSGGLPESATDAKVTLQIGKEKRKVALAGDSGDFTGKTDLKGVTHFVAVLSVKIDGNVKTVRFKIDRVAK